MVILLALISQVPPPSTMTEHMNRHPERRVAVVPSGPNKFGARVVFPDLVQRKARKRGTPRERRVAQPSGLQIHAQADVALPATDPPLATILLFKVIRDDLFLIVSQGTTWPVILEPGTTSHPELQVHLDVPPGTYVVQVTLFKVDLHKDGSFDVVSGIVSNWYTAHVQ